MENDSNSISDKLSELRKQFVDASPTDPEIIERYCGVISSVLNRETGNIGSYQARQLLADYLNLSTNRPSQIHSEILEAAIKVFNVHQDFLFSIFLSKWGLDNFRKEDLMNYGYANLQPSLAETAAKTLGVSFILHPDTIQRAKLYEPRLLSFMDEHGFSIVTMVISRIRNYIGYEQNRNLVTLASASGIEIETELTNLKCRQEHKNDFAQVGQVYDVLIKATFDPDHNDKSTFTYYTCIEAYLSNKHVTDILPTSVGYIDYIDRNYNHIHVFDSDSRHFVAMVQQFPNGRVGDFVRFVPIIPFDNKFKSSIILSTLSPTSSDVEKILREIRITSIDNENGYLNWDLIGEEPITERLSSFQLSQGEKSPSYRSGQLKLDAIPNLIYKFISNLNIDYSSFLRVGYTFKALVFLKRGKDYQKRPYIAKIFKTS